MKFVKVLLTLITSEPLPRTTLGAPLRGSVSSKPSWTLARTKSAVMLSRMSRSKLQPSR